MTTLSQQEIAILDGYIECFVFADGQVYCTLHPDKRYSLAVIEKQPFPCTKTETVVYRITTPDGIKGTAVIAFAENESD